MKQAEGLLVCVNLPGDDQKHADTSPVLASNNSTHVKA